MERLPTLTTLPSRLFEGVCGGGGTEHGKALAFAPNRQIDLHAKILEHAACCIFGSPGPGNIHNYNIISLID